MLLIVGFAGSTNSIYGQSKKAKIGRDPYYGKGKPVSKETKVQPPKITPGEFNIESRQDYIQKSRAPIEAQKQDQRLGKFFGESPEKVRDAKASIQIQQDRDQDINDYIDMSKGIGKDLHLGYKSLDEMEKAAKESPEEFHKKMEARRQAIGRDKFEDSVLAEHDKAMERKKASPSEQFAIDIEKEERAGGIKVQEGKKLVTQPGRATKVAEDIFADIEAEEAKGNKKQDNVERAEIAEARVIIPWKKGVIPSEREAAEKVEAERKQALDEFDKEIRPLQQELDKDVDVLKKKLEEQEKQTLQKQTEEKLVKDLQIRPDQLSAMESIRARGKEFEYETKQDDKTGKYLVKDPDTKKWVPFEDNPITKIGKYVEDMNKVGALVVRPEHKQKAVQAKSAFGKLPASTKKRWNTLTYGQKAAALAGIGVAATAIAGIIALAVVDPAGVFDTEASARNAATLTPTEGQITQDTVQGQEPVEEPKRDVKEREREEETVPVGAGGGYEFF